MNEELPEPFSKVEAFLEEVPVGKPRCWVRVTRTGSEEPEEIRYQDLMAKPDNIEEDRSIKREASRQHRAKMKEWKEKNAVKTALDFEIVRVVADRSPFADDFREPRDLTIYYKLDGGERRDTPASLDRMIRSSPEKFPPDAVAIIITAIKEKLASLRAEHKHRETAASEPKAEDAQVIEGASADAPTATPALSPSVDSELARSENVPGFQRLAREIGEEAAVADKREEKSPPKWMTILAGRENAPVNIDPVVEKTGKEHGKNGNRGVADLIMVEVMKQGIEVFTDQFRMPFAAIERDGHREVHPISMDSDLGLWLTYLYYKATGGRAPSREALDQVVRTLTARARFEGEVHELSLRVAWHKGDLYYDLGREDRKVVRISPIIKPHGWEIMDRPPIMFKRNAQMLSQVLPEAGGDWSDLWDVVNLPLDDYGSLCRSHIVHMFIPGHPRPFIDLYNRRGGGKTYTAMTLRSLVDPTTTPLAELRDLDRNFNNIMDQNYMPVFDNLKTIPDSLEGKFCRVVSGESAQERRLGTNRQQEVYEYQRTGILTSVYQLGLDKPEVAARIIYLEAPFIERPDPEADLNVRFSSARPRILGFIFSTIARAMAELPNVKIGRLPRMADFTVWGEAISRALGEESGTFVKQYEENITQTISATMDANPLAQTILEYFEDGKKEYVGTADPFYQELVLIASERNIDTKSKEAANNWPGAANALTRKMPDIVDDLKRFKLHYSKTTFGRLSDKAKGKMSAKERKLTSSRSIIILVKEDSEIYSELPAERCRAEHQRCLKNIVRSSQQAEKGEKNDETTLSYGQWAGGE